MNFLNHCNQIYSRQFGFCKAHSTVDTLINITECIRKSLDKGEFDCGVFDDLQKAFDTVDHTILLAKLDHYGIRGIVNQWFKWLLISGSKDCNMLFKSKLKFIMLRVPQDSVLGPLFFLLYINDLQHCIHTSETYHFADDTHLLKNDLVPFLEESTLISES